MQPLPLTASPMRYGAPSCDIKFRRTSSRLAGRGGGVRVLAEFGFGFGFRVLDLGLGLGFWVLGLGLW